MILAVFLIIFSFIKMCDVLLKRDSSRVSYYISIYLLKILEITGSIPSYLLVYVKQLFIELPCMI